MLAPGRVNSGRREQPVYIPHAVALAANAGPEEVA